MTARELIVSLQSLGGEALDKEIIIFDGSSYYTPYRIEILDEQWGKELIGKIIVD